jgi:hypothetical protein
MPAGHPTLRGVFHPSNDTWLNQEVASKIFPQNKTFIKFMWPAKPLKYIS